MSCFYLGGPINGCSDAEAHDWREQVKTILESYGHSWSDPMDRDYRGREMEPGIADEIVELDKQDIDACDILLMNCPRPSVGTSMEAMYGWQTGKKVLAVIPPEGEPSPWLVYHTHTLHRGAMLDLALLLARAYAK